MDKHIATLLKTNNRVIIPGFGALIAREGGEKLTFNELLKFDDGLLTDYVSNAENTDKNIASDNIKKYVNKVSAALKKGENVTISTIGELVVDDKGKIQFNQSGSPKDIKTEPAPVKPKAEPKTEPAKPVSPPPPPPPITTASEEKTEPSKTKIETKKETKKEEPKMNTETSPKSSSAAQTEYKRTAAVDKPQPVKTTTQKTPPPKAGKAPRAEGDRKKKGWIIWVIVLVILVGGGTTSWFLFTDEIKAFIHANMGKKQPELPIVLADTTDVETTDTLPDEVIEDKDIVPLDPYAKTGQFYVVAGCFRYERNADRYVTVLQNKGYNSKKFGKRKGLYVVCFEIYETKHEALKKMREIRNTIEPEAWVLKY